MKDNQVLVYLHSQDFSFVGDEPIIALYQIFKDIKIKPNLIQTGAISVQLCVDDRPEKVEQLAAAAAAVFDVQIEKGLSLLSIRHYNSDIIARLTDGKQILLEQKTTDTLQIVYRG